MPPPLRALFPHCLERESIWKDSSRCMLHGEIGVIDAAEQVWHAFIPWCLLTSVHSQARLRNLLSCTAPVCNLRVTSAAGRTASSKANAKWKVKSNPGLQKKENSFSFRAEAPVPSEAPADTRREVKPCTPPQEALRSRCTLHLSALNQPHWPVPLRHRCQVSLITYCALPVAAFKIKLAICYKLGQPASGMKKTFHSSFIYLVFISYFDILSLLYIICQFVYECPMKNTAVS